MFSLQASQLSVLCLSWVLRPNTGVTEPLFWRLFRFVLQSVGAAFQQNFAKNAKTSSKSESATVVGYVVPGVQSLFGLKQLMQLLCVAATLAKPCKRMISQLRKAAFLADARFSSSRDHIRHRCAKVCSNEPKDADSQTCVVH